MGTLSAGRVTVVVGSDSEKEVAVVRERRVMIASKAVSRAIIRIVRLKSNRL